MTNDNDNDNNILSSILREVPYKDAHLRVTGYKIGV